MVEKITLQIHPAESNYSIIVGADALTSVKDEITSSNASKIALLSDSSIPNEKINPLLQDLKLSSEAHLSIKGGESLKNLDGIKSLYTWFEKLYLDRNSLVLAFGGGALLDAAGFAAATYLRGIKIINIPSTLLAAVDASIGGKNGINFNGLKNQIGTIAQPYAVVVDTTLFNSLSPRSYLSGWAEIIKHALIADKEEALKLLVKKPASFQSSELDSIISKSIKIKKQIVEADPFEKNLRRILNFGHTIGHALESVSLNSETPLLHGEAVALGMLAESKLSLALGLLKPDEFNLIANGIFNQGFNFKLPKLESEELLKLMQHDKKTISQEINWSLLDGIGHAKPGIAAPIPKVTEAIEWLESEVKSKSHE